MQWSKEKQKEERKKQALPCDREYAAVIEFDLRKRKKKQFSHHNHPFYSLRCQPFIAVPTARLAMVLNWALKTFVLKINTITHGWSQSYNAFGKLHHGRANNAPMSQAPTNLGRGTGELKKAYYFVLVQRWERPLEKIISQFFLVPVAGERRKFWLKLHWTVIRSIVNIPGIIRASHWYAVLVLSCIYNNITNLNVLSTWLSINCITTVHQSTSVLSFALYFIYYIPIFQLHHYLCLCLRFSPLQFLSLLVWFSFEHFVWLIDGGSLRTRISVPATALLLLLRIGQRTYSNTQS